MTKKIIFALCKISMIMFIIGCFLPVLDFTKVLSDMNEAYSAIQLLWTSEYLVEGLLFFVSLLIALLSVIISSEKNALCLLPLCVCVFIFIADYLFKKEPNLSNYSLSLIYGSGMKVMFITSVISAVLSLLTAIFPENQNK